MALVLRSDLACRQNSEGWSMVTSLCPAPPPGLSQVLVELALFLSPCLTAEGGDFISLAHCGFMESSTVPHRTNPQCLLEEPMYCHHPLVHMLEEFQVLVHREPHPFDQEGWRIYLSPQAGGTNNSR